MCRLYHSASGPPAFQLISSTHSYSLGSGFAIYQGHTRWAHCTTPPLQLSQGPRLCRNYITNNLIFILTVMENVLFLIQVQLVGAAVGCPTTSSNSSGGIPKCFQANQETSLQRVLCLPRGSLLVKHNEHHSLEAS